MFLGASAIEDKLQDGVPEPIYKLFKVGHFCTLEGVKLEVCVHLIHALCVLVSC